jgi:hypothetical protein
MLTLMIWFAISQARAVENVRYSDPTLKVNHLHWMMSERTIGYDAFAFLVRN